MSSKNVFLFFAIGRGRERSLARASLLLLLLKFSMDFIDKIASFIVRYTACGTLVTVS